MRRRTFFGKTLSASLALSAIPLFRLVGRTPVKTGDFPKRPLGKTGERLSIIGFGGILVNAQEQSFANNLVSTAFDRGINYYDVAPSYGNAEEKLGPALEPYRKKCFLACKTTERKAEGATRELYQSLKYLKTDYFDLYQLHALSSVEDVETVFAPGGAMEVFTRAKKEGKVRFLGFSAHSQEAALLAMKEYDFDTILFPVNFVCWMQGDFGPAALALAREKGMGILALKGLAYTRIPEGTEKPYERLWYIPIEDGALQDLSLRFTLSQGITSAIPPGDPKFWPVALRIAENFTAVSDAEVNRLKQLASGVPPLFRA